MYHASCDEVGQQRIEIRRDLLWRSRVGCGKCPGGLVDGPRHVEQLPQGRRGTGKRHDVVVRSREDQYAIGALPPDSIAGPVKRGRHCDAPTD
jgi:hypothetical protein